MTTHTDGQTVPARMVAAIGPTAGQEVTRTPRFACDPFPWGHGPDMNDGLRFSDYEVRPAVPGDAS